MASLASASSVTDFDITGRSISISRSGGGLDFTLDMSALEYSNSVMIGTQIDGTKLYGSAGFLNGRSASCAGFLCTAKIIGYGEFTLGDPLPAGAYLKYDFNVEKETPVLTALSLQIMPLAVAPPDFDWVVRLFMTGQNEAFSRSGSGYFGNSISNGPDGDFFGFVGLGPNAPNDFRLELSITPRDLEHGELLRVNIPNNTLQIAGTREAPNGDIPEPASLLLAASGAALLAYRRWRT